MIEGFFRVAACAPSVSVADCDANADAIVQMAREAASEGVRVAVFPEMSVTAYTCGDLFHNRALLDGARDAVLKIARQTSGLDMVIAVGAPVAVSTALYNCAVVIYRGSIRAIVAKSYIPGYNEFYEERWWSEAPASPVLSGFIGSDNKNVEISAGTILEIDGVRIGFELCEDLWVSVPPSCHMAMAGAEVIFNLSASDDLIGKYSYLTKLIAQQSARCICGYVYAGAGFGESSTDLVFDGKAIIAENGSILSASPRWQPGSKITVTDIDIMAIRHDRMRMNTFAPAVSPARVIKVNDVPGCGVAALLRQVNPRPFVPASDRGKADRCAEILNIQVAALAKRLSHIHASSITVGISGGLDSTLALLVAVRAFDRLGLRRTGIIGVTMPGFGTTGRTRGNAVRLMEQLGVTIREVPIADAVRQHFADIGHDPAIQDTTYENCQARERTQILMDIANQTGGIVLGTGDMSELALGWATYNGDHMSMYGVNAGVPKTLVKFLVRHVAMESDAETRATLLDIFDTPISPELIPADADGNITQKTEDLVGPYDLHDFFLYYTLRYGFTPARIFALAENAFSSEFSPEVILKWERIFFRRFFSQQFKRSCMPDGPKVGSVCLSPRGDWRMPSDASARLWLDEIDNIAKSLNI